MKYGKVYLVGAGPGDLSLLTLKGYRCLQEADVVVYDFLTNPSMLNIVRPDCELIFAGKQSGHHFKSQHETNMLIKDLAQQGKTVVRLKGGDPYIFGRGGEEAQILLEYGIQFEIVCGVSSCYSVPSYSGIPLTHRDYSSSFHVITGHKKMNNQCELDFNTLSKLDGTLVFLMGLANLHCIVEGLILSGKSSETPVAVIQHGTTAHQKTAIGTLATIEIEVVHKSISTPALIVIGDVVLLSNYLNWFEHGKLFGKKIIATGTPQNTKKLSECLNQYGAETEEISLITCKKYDNNPVSGIDWSKFSWIVFTSENGVLLFWEALHQNNTDLRKLLHLKFASIGSGTAKELEQKGIYVDCMPEKFESKYLAESLISKLSDNDNVLLVRAENGTTVLPELLKKANKKYSSISLYKTETDERKKEILNLNLIDADYVVFSSSSAVRAYASMVDKPYKHKAKIISIGEVTTKTAEECGISVSYTAKEATILGVTETILEDSKKESYKDYEV